MTSSFDSSRFGSPVPRGGASPAPKSKPLWLQSAILIGTFTMLRYVIEIVDVASDERLEENGVGPRSVDGLRGILFAPVLHDDWAHLFANTVPLLVLGFLAVSYTHLTLPTICSV